MGILAWLVLGLVAGLLARLLTPGEVPGGIFVTIVIGIVGALIGGWIGSMIGWGTVNEFDFRSILLATVGGVVLLLIHRLVFNRRAVTA